ncbi:pyridoxamine 5'-phosphate oxidase family protein [Thermanaerovibrio acidaminovorans]|uniref:pyridoxamine 5'-phosphate oxidase family protein n=1 Tax=Thermanaerovibrio acidaminovorans TaxID=81462 RepID=UPI0003219EFC|nr:pyridoxamine 5'-phosphate oxidase family protein [Thermanaerovibrio acidaminovorans]
MIVLAKLKDMYDFLAKNPFGFLATWSEGGPRVRPFMFQFEDRGCPLFCLSNDKEVYGQLKADPRCEVAFCTPDWSVTLRIRGKAEFFPGLEQKKRILDGNETLREMYGTPDNPRFEVFRLVDFEAFFWDFSGRKDPVER